MKYKRYFFSTIFITLIVFAVPKGLYKEVEAGYTQSTPINIYSDSDLESYSFPGSGTEADPYIIENYNITVTSGYAISIRATTKYVVVRNNFILASDSGNGIYIFSVATNSVQLVNNTIVNGYNGIYVSSGGGILIENNTVTGGESAYYLMITPNINFTNNKAINPTKYGLRTYNLNYFRMDNNTLIGAGISLSTNSLSLYPNYDFENNTINGKQLKFLYSASDQVLDKNQYGQIIIADSTNITIRNYISSKNSFGVYIYYSENITIENSFFSKSISSIKSLYSSNIKIRNVTIEDMLEFGSYFDNSHDVIIEDSFVNNSISGQYIRNSYQFEIKNVSFMDNNNYGIYLWHTSSINITDSNFSNCKDGLFLKDSEIIKLESNIFSDCYHSGIYLYVSDNVIIKNNILNNCGVNLIHNSVEWNYEFENNIVNGKPLGVFYNETGLTIDSSYSQLILVNCTDFTIENAILSQIETGINIIYGDNILIRNTSIYNFTQYGIKVEYSKNIDMRELYIDGENKEVYGLYAYNVSTIFLNHSIFTQCIYSSIYGEEVADSLFTYNIFNNNTEYTLYLSYCTNLSIYGNDFLLNVDDPYIEDSSDVIFYNSELEIGNCYSKWNGSSRYPIETDYGFIYDEFPINDTDRDQLNDSLEVFNYETDPFLADSDGDLLNDFDELINYGTNPNSSDTDKDGMPDKWEVDNSLDPTTDDTDEDLDNDGLT
ncbi:MAG: right-handed parallel beta-helix repeat-containing protein, partial [Candidatus Heimdallarchaeaceae archaeon]